MSNEALAKEATKKAVFGVVDQKPAPFTKSKPKKKKFSFA